MWRFRWFIPLRKQTNRLVPFYSILWLKSRTHCGDLTSSVFRVRWRSGARALEEEGWTLLSPWSSCKYISPFVCLVTTQSVHYWAARPIDHSRKEGGYEPFPVLGFSLTWASLCSVGSHPPVSNYLSMTSCVAMMRWINNRLWLCGQCITLHSSPW